jgi:hypothetical protein
MNLQKLFEMRSSMLCTQFAMLAYRSANWLAGLNVTIDDNMRLYFRSTDFWTTLFGPIWFLYYMYIYNFSVFWKKSRRERFLFLMISKWRLLLWIFLWSRLILTGVTEYGFLSYTWWQKQIWFPNQCICRHSRRWAISRTIDIFNLTALSENFVTWHLKAGIVKPEETFITRKWLGKHFPAATNTQIIEVLLKTMFSIRSVRSGYKRWELSFGSAESSWALQGWSRTYGNESGENRQSKISGKRWRYSLVPYLVVVSWGNWQEFCTGGCDKRNWAREAEESPLL